MTEFELIRRYFTRPAPGAVLGVGDDAALLRVEAGMELALSSDMLVSGTHFFADTDPFLLGHKTLAVNLSDLAAMGAQPRWATLALALPQADEAWLQPFSRGFWALADAHGVELVGGDTTRGPLNLCVTIMGVVPAGQALRRSGAAVGDDIWVSGAPGTAALGLAHLRGEVVLPGEARTRCLAALQQPQPRVALGSALRGIAHSAIDVSDGLLADLGHLLEASGLGAEIELARLLQAVPDAVAAELWQRCVLAGGDDYELCFTAAPDQRAALAVLAERLHLPLTRIGSTRATQGCTLRAADGRELILAEGGYDHFR